MKQYHFTLCGVRLRLESKIPPQIVREDSLFVGPPQPADICVTLKAEETIRLPDRGECESPAEHPTFREGSRIQRFSWDHFRTQPHFSAEYSLEQADHVRCRVRRADWPWATRDKYLWMGIALNSLLLHRRVLIFHASYIAVGGEGILFAAPSGRGKSTQAQLWQEYRSAEIINGDKAGVRLTGAPTVCGVPFSGTSGICRNLSLPLKAIVLLSQAAENTVCRLSPSQAVSALFPNCFADKAIGEEWTLALRLMLDLVEAVPVVHLACTPDRRAVETLEQALAENRNGGG